MTIDRLIAVAPPPAAPTLAFRGSWARLESEIGRELPADYKAFARLYGVGAFCNDVVTIFVPRGMDLPTGLESEIRVVSDAFRELGLDGEPYRLWPEPDGLIPLGVTDGGDYIFWLPLGAPNDWKIAVCGRATDRYEVFDCDLTDFLAGLVTGEILPDCFPAISPHSPFIPLPPLIPDWRRDTFLPGPDLSLSLAWRMGNFGPSGVSPTRKR